MLVGGTGWGKAHLSIANARNGIRGGARGRFYNSTDLVNLLELETHQGRTGKLTEQLSRLDLLILDELGICRSHTPAATCYSISSVASMNVAAV